MTVVSYIRSFVRQPWLEVSRVLPATLAYWCAVRVITEACTGKYKGTIWTELSARDAGIRFARIHGFPGNGADDHYDSNRRK
jgi:hypothetical protein